MASQTKLYRDKRAGKIAGVCAGVSDYTGIEVVWVRIATILLLFTPVGGFTFVAYIVLAFILPTKPPELYEAPTEEREFWQNVRTKPRATMDGVKLRFAEMERRMQRMEAYVTSSRRDLDREFDKLRES